MGFDLCPDSAAHSQMVVWEWSEITPKECGADGPVSRLMATSVMLPCVRAEEGWRKEGFFLLCMCVYARVHEGFTHFRATTACGSSCWPQTDVNSVGAYLTRGIRLH